MTDEWMNNQHLQQYWLHNHAVLCEIISISFLYIFFYADWIFARKICRWILLLEICSCCILRTEKIMEYLSPASNKIFIWAVLLVFVAGGLWLNNNVCYASYFLGHSTSVLLKLYDRVILEMFLLCTVIRVPIINTNDCSRMRLVYKHIRWLTC